MPARITTGGTNNGRRQQGRGFVLSTAFSYVLLRRYSMPPEWASREEREREREMYETCVVQDANIGSSASSISEKIANELRSWVQQSHLVTVKISKHNLLSLCLPSRLPLVSACPIHPFQPIWAAEGCKRICTYLLILLVLLLPTVV